MKSKRKKRGRFTPTYIPTPQVYEKVELGEDGVIHHQMAVRHVPVPRYKTRRREGSRYANAEEGLIGISYDQATNRFVCRIRREVSSYVGSAGDASTGSHLYPTNCLYAEIPTQVVCHICKQGPGVHQECERKLALARMLAQYDR